MKKRDNCIEKAETGRKRPSNLPFIVSAAAGNIIWGFSYLFTRVGMDYTTPEVYLSLRFLFAFLIVNIIMLIKKEHISLKGKKIVPLIFLAIAEPMNFFFESYGILYSNTSFSGAVIALAPIFSTVLAIVFLKEYPTKRQAIFCVFPVVGIIIMILAGQSLGVVRPIGVVLLLCSAMSSALYKTANRKSSEEFTPFERTYVVILSACVVFTGTAIFSAKGNLMEWVTPFRSVTFTVSLLLQVLLSSICANMLVNHATKQLSVVKVASFSALTTLTSMFAGVLILHEPTCWEWTVGIILIVVGIWQVTKE